MFVICSVWKIAYALLLKFHWNLLKSNYPIRFRISPTCGLALLTSTYVYYSEVMNSVNIFNLIYKMPINGQNNSIWIRVIYFKLKNFVHKHKTHIIFYSTIIVVCWKFKILKFKKNKYFIQSEISYNHIIQYLISDFNF